MQREEGGLFSKEHCVDTLLQSYLFRLQVKFEPAAPVGTTEPSEGFAAEEQQFPHLYGKINVDAVVEQLQVERSAADGTFLKFVGIEKYST